MRPGQLFGFSGFPGGRSLFTVISRLFFPGGRSLLTVISRLFYDDLLLDHLLALLCDHLIRGVPVLLPIEPLHLHLRKTRQGPSREDAEAVLARGHRGLLDLDAVLAEYRLFRRAAVDR